MIQLGGELAKILVENWSRKSKFSKLVCLSLHLFSHKFKNKALEGFGS